MATEPNQPPTSGLIPHIQINGSRAAEAIVFYTSAFGATEVSRMPADDGKRLLHAHIHINGASLMMHDEFPEYAGPDAVVGVPPAGTTLHLQVDNADTWFDRAVKAGATVKMPVQDMFWGDRYGQIGDPFGHVWSIAHPIQP